MAGAIALLALLAVVASVWGFELRSGSVDFGWHYTLVDYIRQEHAWPQATTSYMDGMNRYPPGAHTAAAIVAAVTGSSLLGIHLVSICCAGASYAFLFILLRARAARETFWINVVASGAAALLEYTHCFFGGEINRNYFYAQMVGTACLLALVVWRSRLDLSIPVETVAVISVTFFLGWVFTISAIQFAGFAVAWRILAFARRYVEGRRPRGYDLTWFFATTVGVCAAIMFHPRFDAARELGTDEGYIYTRLPPNAVFIATALLLVISFLLAIATVRRRLNLEAPTAFVALCGGVAAASVAQQVAFYGLNSGSRYLVTKHIFAVATLLLAAAAVGAIHLLRRYFPGNGSLPGAGVAARFAFAPAALLALAGNDVPWRGESIPKMLQTETFIRAAMVTQPSLTGHTIVLADGGNSQLAFSIGLLRLPWKTALRLTGVTEVGHDASETDVRFAVVAANAALATRCIISSDTAAALTLVDYRCYKQMQPGLTPRSSGIDSRRRQSSDQAKSEMATAAIGAGDPDEIASSEGVSAAFLSWP